MQTVAQGWYVWELTHSEKWLGIVSGAGAIPFLLLAMPGGQLADRFPRKRILLATQVLLMVQAFVLAGLAASGHARAWHIALLSAISAAINAYNLPAQQAFLTDIIDEREALPNALALNSMRFNLARFLGPMLAGFVLYHYNSAVCFLLNAFSFLAVIASLCLIKVPKSLRRTSRGKISEAMTYLKSEPTSLRALGIVAAGALLIWSSSTLSPAIAAHLGFHAGGYSSMISLNGVGAAIGGLMLAIYNRDNRSY